MRWGEFGNDVIVWKGGKCCSMDCSGDRGLLFRHCAARAPDRGTAGLPTADTGGHSKARCCRHLPPSAQVEAPDGGVQYCFLVSQIGNDARVAVQMADAKARDSRLSHAAVPPRAASSLSPLSLRTLSLSRSVLRVRGGRVQILDDPSGFMEAFRECWGALGRIGECWVV